MPDDLHERVKEIAQKTGTDVKSLINMTMKDLADNEAGLVTLTQRVEALEKEVFKK